jgi:general secretion pathway protein D
VLVSRCTITAGRVYIAVLIAALIPAAHFRLASIAKAAPAEAPKAADPPPATPTTGFARVSDVIIQTNNGGQTFVDVATSTPTPYRVLELMNPRRLVVDLEGAHRTTPQKSYEAESPLLKRVRVGQFQAENPAVVRVVADLNGNPSFDVHSTPGGVRIELKPRETMQRVAVPLPNQVGEPPARENAVSPPQPPPSIEVPAASSVVAPEAVVPPPQAPQAVVRSNNSFFQPTPFRSITQNQRLLDSLGLRIVLNYDYVKGEPDDAPWKTMGAPGVEASRQFIKSTGGETKNTIELAITSSPQGGYELVVYGQKIDGSAQGANPDLSAVQQLVSAEITRVAQAPAAPPTDLTDLSYETYYLSYVGADRAVALLKTMGYTTVEYNEQAGETLYDRIYNPIKLGNGHPPIIVKLIDSSKTSLMEPPPSQPGSTNAPAAMPQMPQSQGAFGPSTSGVPEIGGTFLSYMTSGEPQQRLLILYDKNNPESFQSLVNLLQSTVDVPSREIMIEALVIELNSKRTRDLGVTFGTQQNRAGIFSVDQDTEVTPAKDLPFLFTFDKFGPQQIATFKASLTAMLKSGEAELLSNPSVLVLDDRQARIQIGQQVPVTKSVATQAAVISSVDYFPVGIVLNLRPRINEAGNEITMQTEAIVSQLSATSLVSGTSVQVAPVVDNRQVQSIVRVADDTPFIIGGLISNNNQREVTGIPFLSDIPGLGNLFKRTTVVKQKQEVIIVVTPHVVPLQDKYFSYVIPKDSDQFDRFNQKLYRNAYRVRGNDLFDLGFVYESNVYKQLVKRVNVAAVRDPEIKKTESFSSVLKGGAPGEDILVRRMIWEIIDRTHFARYVNPDRIIFFQNDPSAPGGSGFRLAFVKDELKKRGKNALALRFEAQPKGTEERPFVPPKAYVDFPSVTPETYAQTLINGNDRNPDGSPKDWSVLITKQYAGIRVPSIELLQGVLVLKKVLELNQGMPLTLKDFHIGRQIIFPSQEELQQGYQFVDRQVAKLFYEVYNYYPAFEQEFNRETRQMNATLDKVNRQQ